MHSYLGFDPTCLSITYFKSMCPVITHMYDITSNNMFNSWIWSIRNYPHSILCIPTPMATFNVCPLYMDSPICRSIIGRDWVFPPVYQAQPRLNQILPGGNNLAAPYKYSLLYQVFGGLIVEKLKTGVSIKRV